MRLTKLTPNLMVEDVNGTVEFYKNILGFELIMTVPEKEKFDWAMMQNGDVEMMFQSKASLVKEISDLKSRQLGGALTFYIEVEDIKGLYEKIINKTAVVKDFHTTFYKMQEFAIRDNNGFILVFAERA